MRTTKLKVGIACRKLRHREANPIDMKTDNRITCAVAMESNVEETDFQWQHGPGVL